MSPRRTTKSRAGENGDARHARSAPASAEAAAERFAVDAARTASELKCTDVSVLDLRGLSPVCDFIVLATGTSERQMRAVAQQIEDLGKERGSAPYRQSRDGGDTWIVVDFVDVVVHLFEPEQRAFYDLDGLWPEAERLKWRTPSASR